MLLKLYSFLQKRFHISNENLSIWYIFGIVYINKNVIDLTILSRQVSWSNFLRYGLLFYIGNFENKSLWDKIGSQTYWPTSNYQWRIRLVLNLLKKESLFSLRNHWQERKNTKNLWRHSRIYPYRNSMQENYIFQKSVNYFPKCDLCYYFPFIPFSQIKIEFDKIKKINKR